MILDADPATGVDANTDNEWSSFTSTQVTDIAEYSTGLYTYSTVFIHMQREMLGWRKSAVVPVVIFVLVSYSGYWISPGAAPARVTLAIISVLITLTLWSNIIGSMPLVTYPVWLRDYIMGCVFFNLASVFSYTVVNYGMQVRDAHKAKVSEVKAQHAAATEALHHEKTHNLLQKQLQQTHDAVKSASLPQEVTGEDPDPGFDSAIPNETGVEKAEKEMENMASNATEGLMHAEKALIALENGASKLAMLSRIDWHMRWIFPVCFAIYNLIMFVFLADVYDLKV